MTISRNIQLQGSSLFVGNNSLWNNGLKSTQEKLQRQTECSNKVAFLENQMSNLKNMEGDSLEEISRKLEMFHSYEDQIAEAKKEYNNAQMFHVLDEEKERGEQIAEAAEKYEPKTAEERKKEMVEEALGTDEEKGELTESLEELEELSEEIIEENAEELEELSEEIIEENAEELEELQNNSSPEDLTEQLSEELTEEPDALKRIYTRVDIRI